MAYTGHWQPALDEATHTIPSDAASLATPTQRAMPEPTHLEPKPMQRRAVHGHPVIAHVPTNHRTQPLAKQGNGLMHASAQLGFDRVELRLQALAHRLAQHREASIAALSPTDMRETKEVERFGLAQAGTSASLGRIRAELQHPGLLGVQFQGELAQPRYQLCAEPLGVRLHLESEHDIIRIANDDHLAARVLSTPGPDPQVKRVVKIDISQKRRCHSPYAKANFQFERVVTNWRNNPTVDLRRKK